MHLHFVPVKKDYDTYHLHFHMILICVALNSNFVLYLVGVALTVIGFIVNLSGFKKINFIHYILIRRIKIEICSLQNIL
jgi:hypothetical protein